MYFLDFDMPVHLYVYVYVYSCVYGQNLATCICPRNTMCLHASLYIVALPLSLLTTATHRRHPKMGARMEVSRASRLGVSVR